MPEGASPIFLFGAQDERIDAEQHQQLCGPVGTASAGHCEETETRTAEHDVSPPTTVQFSSVQPLDRFGR